MQRVRGLVLDGLEASAVTVEARLSATLRTMEIRVVGRADPTVREGMLRARSAVWPFVAEVARRQSGGILVNLAPADLPKVGRSLDLPLGVVYASLLLGLETTRAMGLVFLGELGLGGTVHAVPGVLGAVLEVRRQGREGVVFPRENLSEARLVTGPALYPVASVEEALRVVRGEVSPDEGPRGPAAPKAGQGLLDLSEVRGQFHARRALEIAAAGAHNLLLEGPPGSGKTMLARRLPGLLPRLTDDEALEVARIQSVMRELDPGRVHAPPFRAPHHTVTCAGLTGGGSPLRPGEFSRAHRGVLFLDEFPEFDRRGLEALREPLEENVIHVARVHAVRSFPADFVCIAAMNPCPCGYFGLADGQCRCTPRQVHRYRSQISGPLLDRFDMRVQLRPVPAAELLEGEDGEASAVVLARVTAAREVQRKRFGGVNGRVPDRVIRTSAAYGPKERAFLLKLVTAHRLSARATRRFERVARTVADLASSDRVLDVHLMESLGFRLGSAWEDSEGPKP